MRRPSWFHITTRSTFLAVALLSGLTLYYLPEFLHLDEFRPQVTEVLERTFRCRVIIGNVTGQLVPYPGLSVGHVVFLEDSPAPRVLASVNGVHLWLSAGTLEGRLRFRAIRFSRPRFILHRDRDRWRLLTLPGAQPMIGPRPAPGSELISEWQIRNGSVEIWDHTTASTSKWVADQFTGSFLVAPQTGALTGKARYLGRQAILDLHYDGAADFPIEAHVTNVELRSVQSLAHTSIPALEGVADFLVKARLQPDVAVQATLEPLRLPALNGVRIHGRAAFANDHLHARLQTGTTTPMTLDVEGNFPKNQWNLQAAVEGYDAGIVRAFYHQAWVDRLKGPGSLSASAQSGSGPGAWSWSATGKNFGLESTTLHLPEWSAKGDAQNLSVYVRAATPQGGTAEVAWALPAHSKDATLEVDLSSVTVREVLQIFNLESKPAARAAVSPSDAMNPFGYEPWILDQGSMQALIHDGTQLEIKDSDFDVAGMHLNLNGTFDLTKSNPQAHIQGSLEHLPVAPVVESFFPPPSPLTGTGQVNFTLAFPLSPQWIRGLNGTLQIEVDNGVLRMLKTVYRVVSVLNLGNYLRLRFPKVTAEGIEFQSLKGDLAFQNGVLSADDAFLQGPNMNVGAKGSLDIPGKHVKLTLRVEMFRFLEDILRDVPITHWIFKKPSKIFLPLVVVVEGPWNDVDVH